ncbi:DUF221 family protein [Schizosaccharomyces japonicus yFS275]|uniref:DUF221 family protein n=1 Tax=Schizosaccharomyces japonicus (strain yFS275 / FY16936) TaxID=402676 RepID=B6K257_SCHJY|nr:DUF221 family protein [Schizosaccharomyces japonicus yFS275]EEB07238.1 DUF221 family protein [Schizosaccharomyces japonicus yFS275]
MSLVKRTSFVDQVIQYIETNNGQGNFDRDSILVSLGYAAILSFCMIAAFSILRPGFRNVYAPRLNKKRQDPAIPHIGNKPWDWIKPLYDVRVEETLDSIGPDATIHLLFSRMCRDLFFFLSIFGCSILIPLNVIATNRSTSAVDNTNAYARVSIQNVKGHWMWGHVVTTYLVNIISIWIISRYYRIVTQVRQRYFRSKTYHDTIYARSILVADLPVAFRSNTGLIALSDRFRDPQTPLYVHICHAVKKIPDMLEKHTALVRSLESVLSKYFKNPDKIPEKRPVYKKKKFFLFTKEKHDAINYYTEKIETVELKLNIARASVRENEYEMYGFITYASPFIAHELARKNKKVKGIICLPAPMPEDIIWKNLATPWSTRFLNRCIGFLIYSVVLVVWIFQTALIATFVANFHNIGSLWPWFGRQLQKNSGFWSLVQGVLGPILTALTFMFLEFLMRYLAVWQGSFTQSARERNVLHKLHVIFTVDNFIIYTLFTVIFQIVLLVFATAAKEGSLSKGLDTLKGYDFVGKIVSSVVQVASFWIMYIAHATSGYVMDMALLPNLVIRLLKSKFLSPTPREFFEWMSPDPQNYAIRLNQLLFYFTIAISYASINPLVLPFAFVLFCANYFSQKYLMLYACETPTESGGAFWRPLVNRALVALELSNVIMFLCVWANGGHLRAYFVIPSLALVLIFKAWCRIVYDPNASYLSLRDEESVLDNKMSEASKEMADIEFGHPALYKPLDVPIVREDAKKLLPVVYNGRIEKDSDSVSISAKSTDDDSFMRPSIDRPPMDEKRLSEFVQRVKYVNVEDINDIPMDSNRNSLTLSKSGKDDVQSIILEAYASGDNDDRNEAAAAAADDGSMSTVSIQSALPPQGSLRAPPTNESETSRSSLLQYAQDPPMVLQK